MEGKDLDFIAGGAHLSAPPSVSYLNSIIFFVSLKLPEERV